MSSVHDILARAVAAKASDIHLVCGLAPVLRINGELILTDCDALPEEDCNALVGELVGEQRAQRLASEGALGITVDLPELGRFRVTAYLERGIRGAAIRIIPPLMRSFAELGLPAVLEEAIMKPDGLILIAGQTGAGKTTTLNACVHRINQEQRCKIILVEDPIEYVHAHIRSLVIHQEVGSDTPSFSAALRHILRQDPDIIGIGEMRDLETISTALIAAETGHLVIGTLHTNDTVAALERIVASYPAHQQPAVQAQLASVLSLIICQTLLPRADGSGLVLATEVLVNTPAIRKQIREGATHNIVNDIISGRRHGMWTLDHALKELYEKGEITYDTAMLHAHDSEFVGGRKA